MGSVAMGTGGSYRFQGATVTQIEHCLYCDRCGSFRIGKRVTGKTVLWIAVATIASSAFWYSVRNGALPGAWFMCFATSLFFISMTGVFAFGYRCKQCGRIHTDMDNVRSYPEYDRAVLDVPYEKAVKLYRDDY